MFWSRLWQVLNSFLIGILILFYFLMALYLTSLLVVLTPTLRGWGAALSAIGAFIMAICVAVVFVGVGHLFAMGWKTSGWKASSPPTQENAK